MPTLTPEQAALVQRQRKSPRPFYYSAALDANLPISLEMEAWLILTPLATRAQFATWLQSLAQLNVRDTAMDDLLNDFLEDEQQNGEDLYQATNSIFEPYEQFRSNLNVAGFEDVSELYTLLQQSTEGLGRIFEVRDDAVFGVALQNELQRRVEAASQDSGQSLGKQRELRSWIPVLLAYAGA